MKSHALGKVGKATEQKKKPTKKEANVERRMSRMEAVVVAVSKASFSPPFKGSV